MKMEEREFKAIAQRVKNKGNVLLFKEGLSSDSVRRLAVAGMECCDGVCAVFSPVGDGSMRYAIGQIDGDLRQFIKDMNGELNGRGGGKPFFAQGSFMAKEDQVKEFFSARNIKELME